MSKIWLIFVLIPRSSRSFLSLASLNSGCILTQSPRGQLIQITNIKQTCATSGNEKAERQRQRERERKGWGRVSLLLTGGYIRQYIVSVVSVTVNSLLQQLKHFSFSMQGHNHRGALLAWCLVLLVLVQQVIMMTVFFWFLIFEKFICSQLCKLLTFDMLLCSLGNLFFFKYFRSPKILFLF